MSYIENPKTKGSGIICAIPQEGLCPQKCPDCFFQSGRSYLEPLEENLPNVPSVEEAKGMVIRMNDGNDSNVKRDVVEKCAEQFEDAFFNTSFPARIADYPGPVVLTLNPSGMTDDGFHVIDPVPPNLMYVRVRVNTWNVRSVLEPAVRYYTEGDNPWGKVPVVMTYMAYYGEGLREDHKRFYEFKKRTLNSYWVLTDHARKGIEKMFEDNPYVHSCGHKGTHSCSQCGNCLREYFATKVRLNKLGG